MGRYIIKNCPARLVFGHINFCQESKFLCQDCTNCIMKQIVGLCKEQKVINYNIDGKERILKAYYHTHLGDKIFELLDIEEA